VVARNIVVTVIVAALMAVFVLGYTVAKPPAEPSIKGYSDGQEIKFFHTEVSDAKVAKILTDMIRSPVLAVPALAEVPRGALATVYVFTNGIKGGGPLKFQPDVFDNPPGTPGYSPLRALNLVTWRNGTPPRVLKSAADVKEAEAKGEVTITRPGVVVNMPMLTWPGGHR
jgi:hypothetical protein